MVFQAASLGGTWRLFLSQVSASWQQELPPLVLCPDLVYCLWIESPIALSPLFLPVATCSWPGRVVPSTRRQTPLTLVFSMVRMDMVSLSLRMTTDEIMLLPA